MFGNRYSNGLPKEPRVTITDFDTERAYDDDRFSAIEVFHGDRLKVICGYFEPGQFIPVHAPASDLVLTVQSGTGTVRAGDADRSIEPGDVVVVEAETARGIKADDDTRLEVLLVTAPPPTDAEHEPVREGLQRGQFDPRGEDA
jgi:quercetin dioxygenase-like cupin family protein